MHRILEFLKLIQDLDPKMDSREVNPLKLKNELLKVYEDFIENPSNKENLREIERLNTTYLNATEILEKPLSEALWILEDIRVYGKGSGLSDSKILESSKKILENLRKS